MYPELFTIGSLTITSFGVMMALAFLTAYQILRSELARQGKDPEFAGDLLMGALIGGIAGAKLYYMILNWDLTSRDPFGMLFSRAGLVWYGGFLGATALMVYQVHRRGESKPLIADALAPGNALAYGIGRLGCFLVGDDYGRPTESWVGIAFPNGSPPSTAGNLRRSFGVSIPESVADTTVLSVHPTQLYEIGLSLMIFAILWRLRGRGKPVGWLFSLWLVLAGLERFAVEFFRAKDDRFFGVLTVAQIISLALVGVGFWMMRRAEMSRSDGTATA